MMENMIDKITPEMLGNVEAYTTAMVVEKWITVAGKIICIFLLLALIGIAVYGFIKAMRD